MCVILDYYVILMFLLTKYLSDFDENEINEKGFSVNQLPVSKFDF